MGQTSLSVIIYLPGKYCNCGSDFFICQYLLTRQVLELWVRLLYLSLSTYQSITGTVGQTSLSVIIYLPGKYCNCGSDFFICHYLLTRQVLELWVRLLYLSLSTYQASTVTGSDFFICHYLLTRQVLELWVRLLYLSVSTYQASTVTVGQTSLSVIIYLPGKYCNCGSDFFICHYLLTRQVLELWVRLLYLSLSTYQASTVTVGQTSLSVIIYLPGKYCNCGSDFFICQYLLTRQVL